MYSMAIGGPPNANGEYALLLLTTAIGAAYVVTRGEDYTGKQDEEGVDVSDFYADKPKDSKALMSQYDTHFIPVKRVGEHQSLNYQACSAEEAQAHEFVSGDFAQLSPLAICYFKW